MKTSPYMFYNWANYQAVLDVFNASNAPSNVESFMLRHSDGKLIGVNWFPLGPFESNTIVFVNDPDSDKLKGCDGRFKVVVKCRDDVKVSVFHYTEDGKIINNNVYDLDDDVFLARRISQIAVPCARWEFDSAWHHVTNMTNFFNKKEIIEGIKEVAYRVDAMFPDRKDKRLGVMDGSSPTSIQPYNHPVGTHLLGEELDLNYYTFDNNVTQLESSPLFTEIWNGINLNSKFDVERNYWLFKLITEYFPLATIQIDLRILNKLKTLSYYDISGSRIFGDNRIDLKHHRHAHVRPGNIKTS